MKAFVVFASWRSWESGEKQCMTTLFSFARFEVALKSESYLIFFSGTDCCCAVISSNFLWPRLKSFPPGNGNLFVNLAYLTLTISGSYTAPATLRESFANALMCSPSLPVRARRRFDSSTSCQFERSHNVYWPPETFKKIFRSVPTHFSTIANIFRLEKFFCKIIFFSDIVILVSN